MSAKNFSRKNFLALTLTTVGASVLGCSGSDEDDMEGEGGNAGSDANGGNGNASGSTSGGSSSGGNAGQQSTGGGGSSNGGSNNGGNENGGAGGNTEAGGGGSGGQGNPGGNGGTGGGSGGNGGSGGQISVNECNDSITAGISDNHGHALSIPLADITAGTTKIYNAQGAAGHSHFVELTADDFVLLQNGGTVTKHACNGGDHEFTLSCLENVEPSDPTDCEGTECGNSMGTLCPDPS